MRPIAPQTKARTLRYHFESREQAEKHFHRVEARTLLFYPGAMGFRYGETVIVEVAVDSFEHCGLLRGRVRFIEEGSEAGAWLEFSAAKVAAAIHSASTAARRGGQRLASDLCVSVKRVGGTPLLCRIEDLSHDGVRLSGVGDVFNPDQEVSVSLLGCLGEVSSGLVRWARNGEAGLRLLLATGSAFPKFVAWAQADRERITEVRHLDTCRCTSGVRREPTVPRAFKSSARSQERGAWQPDRLTG